MNEVFLYRYKVRSFKVIDGDTVDLDIDLGFNIYKTSRFRMYGINAPEKSDKEGWKKATDTLIELMNQNKDSLVAFTIKDKQDKYGRYLVVLEAGSDLSINIQLLQKGVVVEYML